MHVEPLYPKVDIQIGESPYTAVMGLREAKDTFDAFIRTKFKENLRENLTLFERDQILDYVCNGIIPNNVSMVLSQKYFGMGTIEVIKAIRINPAAVMLILVQGR